MAAASQHVRLEEFVPPRRSDGAIVGQLEAWIEQMLRDGGHRMALQGYAHAAVPAYLLYGFLLSHF